MEFWSRFNKIYGMPIIFIWQIMRIGLHLQFEHLGSLFQQSQLATGLAYPHSGLSNGLLRFSSHSSN